MNGREVVRVFPKVELRSNGRKDRGVDAGEN